MIISVACGRGVAMMVDMNKPAAIHADLTAAQIQERSDALTAKLLASKPMPKSKAFYTLAGKRIAK